MNLPKALRNIPDRLLASPPILQFAFWFLVVLVLKHGSLLEPPVWDSAMGVFPPAIYLSETGFDIRSLLQQGNWWEGGPNVHSLSLLTWLIAAIMALTGSPSATFAIVHALTFAVFAWTLVLFSRVLKSYGLAPSTVVAATSFVLLMPLVLVQVGFMYTEILVMAVGVAAWSYWREDKRGLAVLVCVVGLFVKLTAIAIAASVFAVAVLSFRPPTRRKLILIGAIPAALLVNRSLAGWLGANPRPRPGFGTPNELLASLVNDLQAVPDLLVLMLAASLCAVLYVVVRIRRDHGIDLLTHDDPDSRSRLICLAMPLVLMAGVFVMTLDRVLFLPRYLVPAIPFAIGTILLLAKDIRAERVAVILLIGASLLSAVNTRGRLYGPEHGRFSIVERSHAYRDFHAVQVAAIQLLATKPIEIPAFVGKEIDYMISDRMMGYVKEPIANTYPVYLRPHNRRRLRMFPDEFLLLQTNASHGGEQIERLVQEARSTDSFSVIEEEQLEMAGFRATLYRLRRVAGPRQPG